VLAMAPEGTRSRNGAMQRAKPGIAYLALRTDAVIVPVAISGTERLRDWLRLKRPILRVVMGAPFRLPQPEGKPSAAELQHLADLVMIRLGLELPESYRGYYADQIAAVESGKSHVLCWTRYDQRSHERLYSHATERRRVATFRDGHLATERRPTDAAT